MADIPVCVLVGRWVCDLDGIWDFNYTAGTFGKTVNLTPVQSFNDLMLLITNAFEIKTADEKLELTFWSPEVSTFYREGPSDTFRVPPVAIANDCDVAQFLSLLTRRPNTNLYLTIDDLRLSKRCNGGGDKDDSEPLPTLSLSQEFLEDQSMLALIESFETAHRNSCLSNKPSLSAPEDIGGRGEPTLEPRPTNTIVDEEQDVATRPGQPIDKGKGIYVPVDSSEGRPPHEDIPVGFDLGIDGLEEAVPVQERDVVRGTSTVFVEQMPAVFFVDPLPR